jgi:hypothetical protein
MKTRSVPGLDDSLTSDNGRRAEAEHGATEGTEDLATKDTKITKSGTEIIRTA